MTETRYRPGEPFEGTFEDVCGHLHPEGRRRCQLFLGHDDPAAHSWERYDRDGNVVESFEWRGDGDD